MNATRSNTNNRKQNEIGEDLQITQIIPRNFSGGTWVCGTVAAYRFMALAFHEHARCPDYELVDSRISKLWIARLADQQPVFEWDRGLARPAATAEVQEVVDCLAGRLASMVMGNAVATLDDVNTTIAEEETK
jgi:hypothetical protein